MSYSLFQIALVVPDYDEAIAFYTQQFGFELVEDTRLSDTKRWVVVRPGAGGANLLLARAATDEQRHAIGNQTGGRVGFFLHTDDLMRDYRKFKSAGLRIVREPEDQPWGKVMVVADEVGNLWDWIEPNRK